MSILERFALFNLSVRANLNSYWEALEKIAGGGSQFVDLLKF